jgi:drug/metabolite transporter, DME family
MPEREVAYTPAALSGGPWFVLAAAVLWGTTGTAQALAPDTAVPLTVGTVRLVLGGLALLLVGGATGSLQTVTARVWLTWPTLLAAGSMAAYQLFFFTAVARTGVAVGTVVAIGSAPILAGLLGLMVYGERPSSRWIVATLLAIVGCTLLTTAGETAVTLDTGGIFLAVGAGASYALYAAASKQLLQDKPATAVTAVTFSLGGLFLAPLLLRADLSWLSQPAGLLAALHLGLLATGLAYLLFAQGLQRVKLGTAVSLSLAEPLTATLLGLLLLREQLPPLAFVGLILLLGGLVVLIRPFTQQSARGGSGGP